MSKAYRTSVFVVLVVAIVGVVVAIEWTAPNDQPVIPVAKKSNKPVLVNQQPFETAQRFQKYVASREEDEFSREAIRLADRELDLDFSTALRRAQQASGDTSSPETKELRQRVLELEPQVKNEQSEVVQLSAAVKANASDALQQKLELRQAELSLSQEELDDAKEDLARTGNDAESMVQRLLVQHQAQERSLQDGASLPQTTPFRVPDTLLDQIALWRRLGKRLFYLERARQITSDYERQLTDEHAQLGAQLKQPVQDVGAGSAHTLRVAALKRQAEDRQSLAEYGKRIEAETKLARVYSDWATLVTTQRQEVAHAALISLLWILLIVLALVAIGVAIDYFLLQRAVDRRRRGAMRMVVRFILQVVGIVGVLFIFFGRPSQLSTLLGLAGAGLTVALKDFIVGFFGWFVLMGKNGIRVGDWVEINGISGEVVEIGILRTMLLETGNWTDSGHPTGRKVTFVNSYAIEGHYFNFSTSGQWLWDTLEVLVPMGQEPYPMAESILQFVLKETEPNVQAAEQEWHRETKDLGVQPFTAKPTVELRPSFQGINVVVRYIARAQERYELRTKLYEGVVGLLHQINPKAMGAGRG